MSAGNTCVAQIQFIMGPDDDIWVTMLLQVAKRRAPYQTPVSGYIDGSKRHRTSSLQVIRTGVKLRPSIPARYHQRIFNPSV